jgi:hypothetical protein
MQIGGKLGAGGSPGGAVVLSTSGPSGLETNPLYYKGSEETQRFEQVGGGPGAAHRLAHTHAQRLPECAPY